jgi:hypothetical protein
MEPVEMLGLHSVNAGLFDSDALAIPATDTPNASRTSGSHQQLEDTTADSTAPTVANA